MKRAFSAEIGPFLLYVRLCSFSAAFQRLALTVVNLQRLTLITLRTTVPLFLFLFWVISPRPDNQGHPRNGVGFCFTPTVSAKGNLGHVELPLMVIDAGEAVPLQLLLLLVNQSRKFKTEGEKKSQACSPWGDISCHLVLEFLPLFTSTCWIRGLCRNEI